MVTFQMTQFTAAVFMMVLTMKLLLLHGRRSVSKVATNSRWLMAMGTLTLSLQFALQLTLGLRQMGVTQAVLLNLAMFMPTSFLFSWSVMLLQRRGQMSRTDWLLGPIAWLLTMAILAIAAATDGQPLLTDTPELRHAELAGSAIFILMQGYYTVRESMNLIAMQRALQDYYDKNKYHMLAWMKLSITLLMMLSMTIPLIIFGSGKWLMMVSFIFYFAIFYLVDSFCSYLNSNAPERMQEAEENADEVKREMKREAVENAEEAKQKAVEDAGDEPSEDDGGAMLGEEAMKAIDEAVAAWKAQGGHCQTGLLLPLAAAGIGIPKYKLTYWLHQQGLKYTEWIAELRVEEAKRTIEAHPDWQNEAVAERCGFTERTLLRTFKKLTGMTPTQYAMQSHGTTQPQVTV